jgi:hypothetical protein
MSDLAKAKGLETLLLSIPHIKEETDRKVSSVLTRAKTAQRDGVLTPELSQALLYEMLAYMAVYASFEAKVKTFQAAAGRSAGLLTP